MRTLRFKLQLPVKKTPNLKDVKKKLNAAVKSVVDAEAWIFDGRVTSVVMVHDVDDPSSKSCQAQVQIVKRKWRRDGDEDAMTAAVLTAVEKIGWLDVSPKDDDDDFQPVAEVEVPTDSQVGLQAVQPEPTAEQADAKTTEDVPAPDAEVIEEDPGPINIDRGTFFDHLYDREAQVELLYSTIKAAVMSDFQSRFHAVLLGPPGCGKTDMLQSVRAMLGEDHVVLLNGPSTTKAGAEQLLLNTNRIKPFLLIEELEKMPPEQMQWLLGLLNERGEVRRTNARDGHMQRDARVLCIATVNNQEKFARLMDGALASRFGHEIYCPRPSSDVLQKIALREIAKVGGNPMWADPAVKYCVEIEKTYDPRRILTVCLSGGDELLEPGTPDPNAPHEDAPGRYQQALMNNQRLRDEAAKQK